MNKKLLLVITMFSCFCISYAQNTDNYFYFSGSSDVYLRNLKRGTGGRALVHEVGNALVLNYANDFTGGVKVYSNLSVSRDLEVLGDLNLSKKLKLASADITGGWRTSYIEYPGHTLRIGPPKGGWAHTFIDIVPGSTTQDNCKSVLTLYTTNKAEEYQRKIVLESTGNSFFNGGNVGIGTAEPLNLLDVNGTIGAKEVKVKTLEFNDPTLVGPTAYTNIYYSGHFLTIGSKPGAPRNNVLELKPGGVNTEPLSSWLQMYTAPKQGEHVKKVVVHTNGISYFNGGNVGIGTERPQNLLDVNGTIRAREVKVEVENWSDFVFDKDYKLPSLQEVEAHINEHKHLPNIPSETQVKEEGINLSEMQAKLLQKIEELTLYVIKQEKEIEKLKQGLLDKEQ